jgi:hypothetical protein
VWCVCVVYVCVYGIGNNIVCVKKSFCFSEKIVFIKWSPYISVVCVCVLYYCMRLCVRVCACVCTACLFVLTSTLHMYEFDLSFNHEILTLTPSLN